MSDYRILVTGSRDYTDERYVRSILQPLIEIAQQRDQRPVVVQGGCPLGGADHLAEVVAYSCGARLETFYADWEKYGKAAGPIRNQEMVDAGADICVAFPLSGSRGTYDCITRAREAGIPVWEVPPYE